MMTCKFPIILASGSRARKAMLEDVGLNFTAIPADIDEDKILQDMRSKNEYPEEIAAQLAIEKAQHISLSHPDSFVIGSDQVLECDDVLFQKAKTKDEARDKLKTLKAKTHHLIASVCVVKNKDVLWQYTDTASLTMHDFDDAFLETYLDTAEDDILSCVGAYAFEKHGAWLFETIDANYFTILGMPLLPLLAFLRQQA